MAIRSFKNGKKTLIRFVAFSPVPVNGFFKYKDTIQIFSLPDEAPKPTYIIGEHPLIIEYAFDSIDSTEIIKLQSNYNDLCSIPPEEFLDTKYNFSKQDEIISLLSVITKYQLTKEYTEYKWVLPTTEGTWKSIHAQVGYFWEGLQKYSNNLTDIQINKVPLIDDNKYYNNEAFAGENFTLCEYTPHLLDKYFTLDEEKKEAFLSSCILFTQSSLTWKVSHSLAYVGFVSSIETLIEYDYKTLKIKNCADCGQPQFKVRQKFIEFMQKYGIESPEFKKYIDKLYNRRSAIGHKGQLLSHDMAGKVIGAQTEMEDYTELRNLQKNVRIALINWLLAIK